MTQSNRHVCAIVVTFNRSQLLSRCLSALQKQLPEQDILVVNNASSDDTLEVLARDFPNIPVLNLPANSGGAGGFHAGMERAYAQGYEYLWLMDDDGMPAENCLAELLKHATPQRVTLPVEQHNEEVYGLVVATTPRRDVTPEIVRGGRVVEGRFLMSFVGPLIGRGVVEKAGLPDADFFIWLDDYDYSCRIHRIRGLQIIAVPQARFFHDLYKEMREVSFLGRSSQRSSQAVWKTYYAARNGLVIERRHHSRAAVARYLVQQLRIAIGELIYDPDYRERVGSRWRGLRDGWSGKMGKNH